MHRRARAATTATLATLRALVAQASPVERAELLPVLLDAADRLAALANAALPRAATETVAGLLPDTYLRLRAQRTGVEARALLSAAAVLASMPRAHAAFAQGRLSWAQVRVICAEARRAPVEQRQQIDALVADYTGDAHLEPDAVVEAVQYLVSEMCRRQLIAREDRRAEGGWLWAKPRYDGTGGRIAIEADSEGFATPLGAAETFAGKPSAPEDAFDPDSIDPSGRAAQRYEGIVCAAEVAIAAAPPAAGRPRPRFVATVELTELAGRALTDPTDGARARAASTNGARASKAAMPSAAVLWPAPGPKGYLRPMATEVAACDAH